MEERSATIQNLENHARHIRETMLDMAYGCGYNSHLGGGLSCVEALTVLYGDIMNVTDKGVPENSRDKFILSKGHGVLGYYAALAEFGMIKKEMLDDFLADGSDLIAHPVMNSRIGIEASTGSLGQGISIAVGLALAAKKKQYDYHTYVLCGNGEFNEGSVWEACMSAVNYRLDNFTLFLDNNHMQSDGFSDEIMNVSERYGGMLRELGFYIIYVNGNDIAQVYDAFRMPIEAHRPKAIIGDTVKGKGISFMEHNPDWHHNRLVKEQYDDAIKELYSAYD